MVAIVDYGVGNLFSVKSSFNAIGAECVITRDARLLAVADQILLPGVGAFEDAARKLRESGVDDLIRLLAAGGKPIMGICLGMQLLFDKSYEYGEHTGLGLIPGEIRPIADVVSPDVKIPHMGWNALQMKDPAHPLFRYVRDGECVYFVHSYYATGCEDSVLATAEYTAPLTAAVAHRNVMGCQFHPEKSGQTGLNILKAFCEMKETTL